jgi:hypothetical protein
MKRVRSLADLGTHLQFLVAQTDVSGVWLKPAIPDRVVHTGLSAIVLYADRSATGVPRGPR